MIEPKMFSASAAGSTRKSERRAARADLQRSIRICAMRQRWGGKPVDVEQAQRILVAALGVLAAWYGYGRR